MLKFTVLTENQERDGLECEHGLSFYIKYKNHKYLLDAGKSDVFLRNAQRLGIDLQDVETAMLSHAHYDHADGFDAFFQENMQAKVYACAEGRKLDCYSVGSECTRYIGIAPEILEKYAQRFCWVDKRSGEPTKLADGVWLVPHNMPGLEKIGARTGMYRKQEEIGARTGMYREQKCPDDKTEKEKRINEMVPDDFEHEQSLVIETDTGLVVFNSCSHGGVSNIVSEVRAVFPGKQIIAYIGGFHLKAPGVDALNCSEAEVEELGYSLLELGIRKIYTGHCTGKAGYEILKRVMGDGLQKLYPGLMAKL